MFVRTRADLLFARPNLLFKYCTCLLFGMSHVPLLLKPNSKTGIKITVARRQPRACLFGPGATEDLVSRARAARLIKVQVKRRVYLVWAMQLDSCACNFIDLRCRAHARVRSSRREASGSDARAVRARFCPYARARACAFYHMKS